MIYTSGDFNLLKNLLPKKNFFFLFFSFLYIKLNTFVLFTVEPWTKNDIEVIEYGGEIWENQKHLEKKLGIANISDKTQYYS